MPRNRIVGMPLLVVLPGPPSPFIPDKNPEW